MKFLFIMTVAVLLPFTLATAAGAEPTQSVTEIQPNADATAAQIEPLSVGQASDLVSASDRSNRLSNEAQQINQDLDAQNPRSPRLRDLLNLPDGMIIRGSSRGGIGIGTEY